MSVLEVYCRWSTTCQGSNASLCGSSLGHTQQIDCMENRIWKKYSKKVEMCSSVYKRFYGTCDLITLSLFYWSNVFTPAEHQSITVVTGHKALIENNSLQLISKDLNFLRKYHIHTFWHFYILYVHKHHNMYLLEETISTCCFSIKTGKTASFCV